MSEKQTIIVKAEVVVPEPPNFLRMTDGQTLPIEAVDNKGLQEIGKIWITEFIKKAERKRAANRGVGTGDQ